MIKKILCLSSFVLLILSCGQTQTQSRGLKLLEELKSGSIHKGYSLEKLIENYPEITVQKQNEEKSELVYTILKGYERINFISKKNILVEGSHWSCGTFGTYFNEEEKEKN
jgi:hypothetical protein